jgi:hypothetical protein
MLARKNCSNESRILPEIAQAPQNTLFSIYTIVQVSHKPVEINLITDDFACTKVKKANNKYAELRMLLQLCFFLQAVQNIVWGK